MSSQSATSGTWVGNTVFWFVLPTFKFAITKVDTNRHITRKNIMKKKFRQFMPGIIFNIFNVNTTHVLLKSTSIQFVADNL